jgi:hypothetical protein
MIYSVGQLSALGEIVAVSSFTRAVAEVAGVPMGIHRRSLASS